MDVSRHHLWRDISNSEGVPALLVPLVLTEDYDGCFGDTNEAMRIVENIVEERTSLTVKDIQDARAEVESRMLPFSTVDFIEKELQREGQGMTWANDIRPYVLERAERPHHRERLLARGAATVFAVAQELAIPEVVVTHGSIVPPGGKEEEWAAVEWQTIKVKMTPELQEKPLVVTKTSTKAREFRSWYDESVKAFLLPQSAWQDPTQPMYARNLLHIDDKRSALKEWPTDLPLSAIHYLPERDDDIRQTQVKGKLAKEIPVARGMEQVARLVQEHYHKIAKN